MKAMVNAHTETAFDRAWAEFQAIGRNCTVRVGSGAKSTTNLIDYMKGNWLSCVEMWSRYHRSGLPLRFNHTTNRIERFFGCLKAEYKVYFTSTPSIVVYIPFYIDFLGRKQVHMAASAIKRFSPNDKFKGLCREAGQHLTK